MFLAAQDGNDAGGAFLGGFDFEFAEFAGDGGNAPLRMAGIAEDFVDAGDADLADGATAGGVAAPNDGVALASECAQGGVEEGKLFAQENADELGVGTGGIEQGAEEIEDGAAAFAAELFADGGDFGEGGVVFGREEKDGADFFHAGSGFFGRQIGADAEGGEDVGAAGFLCHAAVAVFDDGNAEGGEDEDGAGGDVKDLEAAAASAATVEEGLAVPGAAKAGIDGEGKKFAGEGGEFSGGFALVGEGAKEVGLVGQRIGFLKEFLEDLRDEGVGQINPVAAEGGGFGEGFHSKVHFALSAGERHYFFSRNGAKRCLSMDFM